MAEYRISDPGERIRTRMEILSREVSDLKRSQSKLVSMVVALRVQIEAVQGSKIPDQILKATPGADPDTR